MEALNASIGEQDIDAAECQRRDFQHGADRLATANIHAPAAGKLQRRNRTQLHGNLCRAFNIAVGDENVRAAQRGRLRIGVVLCDLDGLKEINDIHGHADGDMAIRSLARALEDADCLFCHGDNRRDWPEFAIQFPFEGALFRRGQVVKNG